LDLVALATLADHVPLLHENRIFVSHGLKRLCQSKRPGLLALLDMTGLWGKKLTSEDVVFKIVPRINVAGRMGQVDLALRLLLEEDPKKARQLAQQLDELNGKRREIEAEVRAEAIEQVKTLDLQKTKALVLWSEAWHPGVLGITAARISQKYHLPTAILTQSKEEAKGSVRGITGINLVEALEACKSYLTRFGGHFSAAGLTLPTDQLNSFREAFQNYMQSQFEEGTFQPALPVDEAIDLKVLEAEFVNQLNILEPFGEKNPEPVFTSSQVEICDSRIVGKNHLKLRLRQGDSVKDAIGFGLGDPLPEAGRQIDLAFSPRWNEYQGLRSIQLQVKDWK